MLYAFGSRLCGALFATGIIYYINDAELNHNYNYLLLLLAISDLGSNQSSLIKNYSIHFFIPVDMILVTIISGLFWIFFDLTIEICLVAAAYHASNDTFNRNLNSKYLNIWNLSKSPMLILIALHSNVALISFIVLICITSYLLKKQNKVKNFQWSRNVRLQFLLLSIIGVLIEQLLRFDNNIVTTKNLVLFTFYSQLLGLSSMFQLSAIQAILGKVDLNKKVVLQLAGVLLVMTTALNVAAYLLDADFAWSLCLSVLLLLNIMTRSVITISTINKVSLIREALAVLPLLPITYLLVLVDIPVIYTQLFVSAAVSGIFLVMLRGKI